MTPTTRPIPYPPPFVIWLLLLSLGMAALPALAADKMEIFELKGRTSQEMIPLLRPFVGPDGTVTGMNNRVIVRTSPERMAEIRRIIDEFDQPPRRLLIHVRDSAPSKDEGDEIRISAGNRHIRIGEGNGQHLNLKHYSTRTREENVRTIQTLEGEPVLILNGVSLPVVTGSDYVAGAGTGSRRITYGYKDVDSGFYAIANLIGDRVQVEITHRRARPLSGSGAIDHRESRNRVSGAVGEWLPVAVNSSSSSQDSSTIGSQRSTESATVDRVWLKVEVLP
ncbi:MAG: secretin N-terminal domain-containing protein [Candidatus Thiodiazotropha sp.]